MLCTIGRVPPRLRMLPALATRIALPLLPRMKTWVRPGRFGRVFFVLCFLALGGHIVSRCFVYQDSGHTQTPRICHIFVLSLLVSGAVSPEMPIFHGKRKTAKSSRLCPPTLSTSWKVSRRKRLPSGTPLKTVTSLNTLPPYLGNGLRVKPRGQKLPKTSQKKAIFREDFEDI